ncbi:aldehyde dehydrogenase family protein [Geodermatophilus sp. DSM 44513]|uniref:aldehyde dehydrogenase family protein n=1 Tax=Geodermatophilus sp. DSM 44513 TaxID=1528104 RepID=UPI0012816AC8|nr:aldehyde dehydrogenase family protein [Geodermatophilus sp. DSM 44513]WNV77090.1 aldehyde dehydrogenase family protein [Geodermatophilus sp. DSM 44513]
MTDTVDDVLPASDAVDRYVTGREFRMLIGGELVTGDRATETVDPSTGAVLTQVPEAGPADVGRAVAAAEAAQPGWHAAGHDGRAAAFGRFAQLLEDHLEELAVLEAIDSGNPVRAMRGDVGISVAYVRGWPGLAQQMGGQVIPASRDGLHYTTSSPYGVVGRITAFNHPLMFAATRPLPALITGNTVVLKPSPQTPLTTLRLAELFAEAFPPGVVNVVTGGAEAGDALVTHPTVKRIAFTGSVPVGLLIQRRAAESGRVKNVSLELGGKNAMVVFPDTDVAAAVEGAVDGMNLTVCQGQSCGSNSRILVHRAVHDEFVAALAERVSRLRVRTAYEETADMGPVVSAAQLARVTGFLDRAVSDGATLVAGGDRPTGVPREGYFVNPAVLSGVQPGMEVAQDEVFGPVVSVLAWDDYDEMVRVANGVEFGLTASVWTSDLDLAHRTAAALDAGYVWVNDSSRHYFGTPFGGTKNSGTGREESVEELWSYVEQKAVHVRLRSSASVLTHRGW